MEKFQIRWSDLDPNRHLANSAFMDFMSQARLNTIKKAGVNHKVLAAHDMGPIAFYEHIYYFKEVSPDEPIYISVELKGLSEDGIFFAFDHNIYNKSGHNLAHCSMMGAWMDLKKRRLSTLPDKLSDKFKAIKRAADFRTLTKRDTRKHGVKPRHMERIEEEG